MEYEQVMKKLKSMENKKNKEGMARFGIKGKNILGIPNPKVRAVAKEIGKNHKLAQKLWASEIHEARMLAAFIDEPEKVTEKQMERWVKNFDSWGICDCCCMHLFSAFPAHPRMQSKDFLCRSSSLSRALVYMHI